MNVTVRLLRENDALDLADMAEALVSETGLFGQFSRQRTINTLLASVYEPDRFLGLIAHDGDTPIGFMGAYLVEHFATDILIAHDLSLYVTPAARGRSDAALQMIDWYVMWAKANGAGRITLANGAQLVNSRAYDRLMKRVGFAPAGAFYAYE